MSLDRRVAQARKLCALLRVPSYRRALRHGVAASVEHARTPLPPDLCTVVDVGSNRGQFALLARHRWPQARVLCFEPLPEPGERLRRLFAADPAVEISTTALSDRGGEQTMHVSRADDSSSLLAMTSHQVDEFPGTDEISTQRVQTTRLDKAIDAASILRPALLKLDVQGTELQVLRGAGALLDVFDVVLAECSWIEFYDGQALVAEILDYLSGHGLRMRSLSSATIAADGRVLQGDIVFTRD